MKMKQLFLTSLVLLLCLTSAFSQIEDFEGASGCPTSPTCPDGWIDNNSCLTDWATSHGSPHVDSQDPISGSKSLWTVYSEIPLQNQYGGEGAFVSGNYAANACYRMEFKLRFESPISNPHPATFKVALANGLVHDASNCIGNPPTPTNEQVLYTIDVVDINPEFSTFRLVLEEFSPTITFNQLWFYVEPEPGFESDFGGIVRIDDIEVENITCGFPCGCPAEGVIINGINTPVYSSDVAIPPTLGGCINIAGTFIIDDPLTISNAAVVLNPGAEIKVVNGGDLDINSTTLEACLKMWRGIRVEANGVLSLTSSIVRDAQYGVFALFKSDIEIQDNDFEECYIGVYANPATGGLPSNLDQTGTFIDNIFSSTDILLPAYNGQTPVPGEKSLAGILVSNTLAFEIGTSTGTQAGNEFFDMYNGILADNAVFNAEYCDIHDLLGNNESGFPLQVENHGLYARDCPDATFTFADINNTERGATVESSTVTINNCFMDVEDTGILYTDGGSQNLSAAFNTILAGHTGIELLNNMSALGFQIKNNTITTDIITTPGSNGIGVFNSFVPNNLFQFAAANIEDNTINTFTATSGILLQDSKGWKVKGNTINHSGLMQNAGAIELNNTRRCQVRENTMIGTAIGSRAIAFSRHLVYR